AHNPANVRGSLSVSLSAVLGNSVRTFMGAREGRISVGGRRCGVLADHDTVARFSVDASLSGRPLQNGLFNGLIWPKVGNASIAYAATARLDFLPLPAAPSFLARQQSRVRAVLRVAPVAS